MTLSAVMRKKIKSFISNLIFMMTCMLMRVKYLILHNLGDWWRGLLRSERYKYKVFVCFFQNERVTFKHLFNLRGCWLLTESIKGI